MVVANRKAAPVRRPRPGQQVERLGQEYETDYAQDQNAKLNPHVLADAVRFLAGKAGTHDDGTRGGSPEYD
jgi:hypothetical protein